MGADICSICSAFLGFSKMKASEIAGPLEALLSQANFKLLEDFLICDSCLIKVQSACKFKASYLENYQKLHIKQEDIENETVCEICKESVKTVDCIPLFHSVTESDKLNIFRFLSFELELKSQDNPLTCELCHKSILNFCIVTKPFSLIIKNEISDLKSKNLNSAQDITVTSLDSFNDSTFDIKEEDAEVTEDHGLSTTYEDFLCKNEEIDLKMENDQIWIHDRQEDGKFNCLICSYQTERKINLNQHIKLKHIKSNEIETFNCQICGFQTRNKYYINTHLKTIHNIIEMFKCHICDYQTQYRPHLKSHLLVHKNSNKTEMFKCHICDYQTQYRPHLKSHLRVHKIAIESDVFSCHICGYRMKNKNYLNTHLLEHKNPNEIEMFKCDTCDYETKYKDNLKRHAIVHKNSNRIKMVKCHICDYQTQYSDLKSHLLVHKTAIETDVFSCHICGYRVKNKNYLKSHLLVHKNSNEIEMSKC